MGSVDPQRRADARERTRRDVERRRRRDPSGGFWAALSLVGAVGWPIVILTVGGAWLGHLLDMKWRSGVSLTLFLLTAGAFLGSLAALRTLRSRRS